MKTNSTQQEILLMTKSSFAQKQWCKKEFDDANKNLTPEENMEEACASGLIQELLPEVFNNENHKMYLWQMHPGFSFLQLELGELPLAVEKQFSLDPHNFLSTIHCN
jgi:hypothetical protein